jgi:hypothetical protein
MKVVCEGLTTIYATLFILLVTTLVKNLKLTFNKHIGMYCWIFIASLVLDRRVITPKILTKKGKFIFMNIIKESHQIFF